MLFRGLFLLLSIITTYHRSFFAPRSLLPNACNDLFFFKVTYSIGKEKGVVQQKIVKIFIHYKTSLFF